MCVLLDAYFFSLRLEPYLAATAIACPQFATPLNELIARTSSTKHALVHGDISPKNILCGPNGPVFLDAECAWYGDPAFDLAFCLNHLLLKCAWRPEHTDRYVTCYDALSKAYLSAVDWEPPLDIANRTATLLPALMLARIKGKSPVEYLTTQRQRDLVCAFAGERLLSPMQSLEVIGTNWKREVPH